MPVKKGDVLVVIDPADFKLALAEDEAALGQAQRQVEGYFANRDADTATTAAKGADVDRARAQLASAEADLAKAQTDLARRQKLAGDGAVSGDELTIAENRLRETTAAVGGRAGRARRGPGPARSRPPARRARRRRPGGRRRRRGQPRGGRRAGQGRPGQARTWTRTVIRAPIDGVVAKNVAEIGQRVDSRRAADDRGADPGRLRRRQLQGRPAARACGSASRSMLTSDLYGGGVKFHGRSSAWPAAPARPSP